MTLGNVEIFYSPLANDLIRQLETAFFTRRGGDEQTENLGLAEGVMVMWLMARDKKNELLEFLDIDRPSRNSRVVRFYLENEEEIETLKPILLSRLAAAEAAAVESEGSGKSQSPRQDYLP